MIRNFFIFVTFFSLLSLNSQENLTITLDWSGEYKSATIKEQEFKTLALSHEFNSSGQPIYIFKNFSKGITKEIIEVTVASIEYANSSKFDNEFIKDNELTIPNTLAYSSKTASNRGQEYIAFEIIPFIYQNGTLKRIAKVEFRIESKGKIPQKVLTKDFAANSVLRDGQWYKIKLQTTGIYKIDQPFLQNLGINTQGLNPNHINIYGNASGMLPELNSIPRPDDLIKNPIQVIGGENNSFNSSTFILFYGVGPDEFKENPGVGFEIKKNIYDEYSYYYISINSADPPLRISNAETTNSTHNQTVTGVDQCISHEKDEKNLIKSGKNWYGEEFDFTLEHTFNFTLTNIQPTEPLTLSTKIAYTNSGGTNSLKVYLNNSLAHNHNFTTVSGNNFARRSTNTSTHANPNATNAVKLVLERTNPSVTAWLDKIELNYRRSLRFTGSQLEFRDLRTVGNGNITLFNLENSTSSTHVWETTNPHNVGIVNGSLTGSVFSFKINTDTLRQFIAFTNNNTYSPIADGRVANQNLHALNFADYLIVTHPLFLAQANRLAELHREDGMSVHVVTTNQIYNEFSSGKADPVAIRWFVKMFYDRSNDNLNNMPKYLCLFGDGTYDPKNRIGNNNNMLITYQSENSENVVTSLTSDDFFGLLDNNESFAGSDGLDVGIGRIIATTTQDATLLVNKIEHYKKNGSSLFSSNSTNGTCSTDNNSNTYGDWRLWITHIADDEDGGQFVRDHESYINKYSPLFPELNYDKIYLDAFSQVITSGGQRYPDVPPLINSRIDKGTLLMNYVGHGGETGLALERIIIIPQILEWKNMNKLPLFVSATCEFTRFDDPARLSAGEYMYLSNKGGAISMMTTTRPVYINVNSQVGSTLYDYVFTRDSEGRPLAMGETLMLTKNNSTTDQNRRSFMLLGDPALRLALPKLNIVVDSINGHSPINYVDTLRSLGKVTIKAHIEDENGNLLSGFNGYAQPSIFDKPKENKTLGQDIGSPVIEFETQKNILYKGKSTITNGKFEFSFIVPKDIDYSFGNGKVSLYGNSTTVDAAGVEQRVIIGGVDPNGINDTDGPEVTLHLNDEKFVNGGITNETPIFIAKLFDENGINAVGNGIGHDITIILDGKTNQPIVLNDYYEAELDSYQKGQVRYQFEKLEPGPHVLTFKVWDVNNNSSESTIEFVVMNTEKLSINHVLNYPNPFTTNTEFFFEHNQVNISLQVQIQIYTISGRLVKTINEPVTTCGFRSNGIAWDGKDDFGDQLAKGVYVYRLSVTAPDGTKDDKLEKLVLLK
jgi:hypothetical protein